MKEHSRTNGLKTTPLGTCQVGLVFLGPGRCIRWGLEYIDKDIEEPT